MALPGMWQQARQAALQYSEQPIWHHTISTKHARAVPAHAAQLVLVVLAQLPAAVLLWAVRAQKSVLQNSAERRMHESAWMAQCLVVERMRTNSRASSHDSSSGSSASCMWPGSTTENAVPDYPDA
jgi:hypothetical protein